MCAKFGCVPTVVSKKGGVQTDRQTDRQTDKDFCSFIYTVVDDNLRKTRMKENEAGLLFPDVFIILPRTPYFLVHLRRPGSTVLRAERDCQPLCIVLRHPHQV